MKTSKIILFSVGGLAVLIGGYVMFKKMAKGSTQAGGSGSGNSGSSDSLEEEKKDVGVAGIKVGISEKAPVASGSYTGGNIVLPNIKPQSLTPDSIMKQSGAVSMDEKPSSGFLNSLFTKMKPVNSLFTKMKPVLG